MRVIYGLDYVKMKPCLKHQGMRQRETERETHREKERQKMGTLTMKPRRQNSMEKMTICKLGKRGKHVTTKSMIPILHKSHFVFVILSQFQFLFKYSIYIYRSTYVKVPVWEERIHRT